MRMVGASGTKGMVCPDGCQSWNAYVVKPTLTSAMAMPATN